MSFFQKLFKKRMKEVYITICGLTNAGKTAILKYLETGRFVETQPTMGINRSESIQIKKLDVTIFDLGGQDDFRALWSEVNEKSDGIVFVVDKTDHMNFIDAKKIFHEVISNQIHKNVVVLVLLHKNDLPGGIDRNDFIKYFNLLNIQFKWACFETSAKTGENIFESFKWFLEQLKIEVN